MGVVGVPEQSSAPPWARVETSLRGKRLRVVVPRSDHLVGLVKKQYRISSPSSPSAISVASSRRLTLRSKPQVVDDRQPLGQLEVGDQLATGRSQLVEGHRGASYQVVPTRWPSSSLVIPRRPRRHAPPGGNEALFQFDRPELLSPGDRRCPPYAWMGTTCGFVQLTVTAIVANSVPLVWGPTGHSEVAEHLERGASCSSSANSSNGCAAPAGTRPGLCVNRGTVFDVVVIGLALLPILGADTSLLRLARPSRMVHWLRHVSGLQAVRLCPGWHREQHHDVEGVRRRGSTIGEDMNSDARRLFAVSAIALAAAGMVGCSIPTDTGQQHTTVPGAEYDHATTDRVTLLSRFPQGSTVRYETVRNPYGGYANDLEIWTA